MVSLIISSLQKPNTPHSQETVFLTTTYGKGYTETRRGLELLEWDGKKQFILI